METTDRNATPNSPDEATPPPVRIVLVDDDDSFRESLGLNLIDEGFAVVSFDNGVPALDYFAQGGAADVIDKSRRLSILVKRLHLITEGMRPVPEPDARQEPSDVTPLGRLELRFDINRAAWDGKILDLTLTEFKIVAL